MAWVLGRFFWELMMGGIQLRAGLWQRRGQLGLPLWDWQGAPLPLPLHTLSLFFPDGGCEWQ